MARKKGTPKTGGRKKGTPNLSTTLLAGRAGESYNEAITRLNQMMQNNELDASQLLQFVNILQKVVLPNKREIELGAETREAINSTALDSIQKINDLF